MSRTYATPTKVQIQPGSDDVVCTVRLTSLTIQEGHIRQSLTHRDTSAKLHALLRVRIQRTLEVFYTCSLARDDPERCKFFQWEDQQPGTPIRQTPHPNHQQTPTPHTAPPDKKRKFEETPTVDPENPFLSSDSQEEVHPIVTQAMRDVSAHLHRQDRLLVAADKMKDGLRKKITELKEKNEALEARNRELEERNKELQARLK